MGPEPWELSTEMYGSRVEIDSLDAEAPLPRSVNGFSSLSVSFKAYSLDCRVMTEPSGTASTSSASYSAEVAT